ncbi:MAG: thrombospondin type 3 repeat-containing protein [Polyangiales bacterium]
MGIHDPNARPLQALTGTPPLSVGFQQTISAKIFLGPNAGLVPSSDGTTLVDNGEGDAQAVVAYSRTNIDWADPATGVEFSPPNGPANTDLTVIALNDYLTFNGARLTPIHVGLSGSTSLCPTTFTGTAIGYAQHPIRLIEQFNIGCSNGTCGNTGGGLEPGDSGGPLLFQAVGASAPVVCGVAESADTSGGVGVNGIWVDPTLQSNIDFLKTVAKDESGNWIGEGPSGAGTRDTDGDGVFDDIDNCASVFNPDQHDTDGDSYGDRCDNCINTVNDQSDGNWQSEVDGLSAGNVHFVDKTSTSPTWQPGDPDNWLTGDLPGDACDRTPLTVLTSSDTGFAIGRNTNMTTYPGAYCTTGAKTVQASASVGNLFALRSFMGDTTAATGASVVFSRTGVQRCSCPAAAATTASDPLCTGKDMAKLGNDCTRSGSQTGGFARPHGWQRMVLQNAASPSIQSFTNTVTGVQSINLTHPVLDATPGGALTAWGWRYDQDITDLPAPSLTAAPALTLLDGLVFLNADYATPTAGDVALTDPTHTLNLGDISPQTSPWTIARVNVAEAYARSAFSPPCGYTGPVYAVPNPILAFPGFRGDSMPVLSVPNPITDPGPVLQVDPLGLSTNVSAMATSAATTALEGGKIAVTVSDAAPLTAGRLGGVVVDPTTRTLTGLLTLGATGVVDHTPLTTALAIAPFGTKTGRTAVPPMAVSAKRQETGFFGELDSSGSKAGYVRIHSFATPGSMTTIPIVGTQRFNETVAATYSVTDDAYYVLDRNNSLGSPIIMGRLMRFGRSHVLEFIGEFSLSSATNFGMTSTADGSLVLSSWTNATSTTTGSYSVVVLAMTPAGPQLRGNTHGTTGLGGPAVLSSAGLVVVPSVAPFAAQRLEHVLHVPTTVQIASYPNSLGLML